MGRELALPMHLNPVITTARFTSCDQTLWCQIEIVQIIKDIVALFRQKLLL